MDSLAEKQALDIIANDVNIVAFVALIDAELKRLNSEWINTGMDALHNLQGKAQALTILKQRAIMHNRQRRNMAEEEV